MKEGVIGRGEGGRKIRRAWDGEEAMEGGRGGRHTRRMEAAGGGGGSFTS